MRVLAIVISVLWLAIPARAETRPRQKIAMAPIEGDSGGKIAAAVADALSTKDYEVVSPKEVRRELERLGLAEEIDGKSTRKLTAKFGAVAVIGGKLTRAGGKKFLRLEVHRRGKPEDGFTIEFKTASKAFRRSVRDEIVGKLEGADDDRDVEDEPAKSLADDSKRAADEDESRKRKVAEEEEDRRRKADDEDRRRKADDEDRRRKPKRTAAADDDDGAVRKRKRRSRGDEAAPSLLNARVGAGGAVAQRALSWQLRSGFTQIPPRVVTYAGSGRVDGELYPLAIADPGSSLAGLGLAATYDKTFGLSIKIPNQTVRAPINQSHYAIGVRYRFAIGETSSIALGVDYARRQYVADRGALNGATLDAPDVDYSALAPGASLRAAITDTVAAFAAVDGMLIFEAGGIQKSASYGPAKVYGIEGAAGVDIALAKQIALRFALEYSQINFSFTPEGNTLANNRDADPMTQDVMGATDRSIGGTVTLGLVY